jgi:hypothetical protein
MTRREKVMATTLIVVMSVMGGGMLFHLFVYQPISEAREQLKDEREKNQTAQNNLADAEAQITNILHRNPRLSQWQKISLPPRNPEAKTAGVTLEEQRKSHETRLQNLYDEYLTTLLTKNGFPSESIVITPRAVDRRAVPKLRGDEPVYSKLAFGVEAHGDLRAVVDSLRAFHKANLLHSIRNLTVSLAQPRGRVAPKAGAIDLSMQIEALMVNGAEERKDLLPEKISYPLHVLPRDPERVYDAMLARNIFTGGTSGSPYGDEDPKSAKAKENKKDVLSFVKLTMLCRDTDKRGWYATLYDQGKGGDEILLSRLWNELKISDHSQNTLLDAKVVLIDEKQLIFKVDGKYYRMQCGDFVYDALYDKDKGTEKPLRKEELKELGIQP